MKSFLIIKLEIVLQPLLQGANILIAVQVNIFILHGPPQPLNIDVVLPSALTIHAHLYVVIQEYLDKAIGSELTALIRVMPNSG
jgi:hypothetical protein